MNTIFKCLYIFLVERVRQFSTYATSGEMDGCRGETSGPRHAKCVKLRTMGGGVMPHVYIPIYISFTSHTHLFSCFWQHFFYFYCRRLILPLLKRDVFVGNGYFSPTRSISTESHFCKPKLAKMLLILIK